MASKWLPKDILRIIKGYEYSLISFEYNKNKIINLVRWNINQPYYLKGTKYHKSDEGQLYYVLNSMFKPSWSPFITRKELIDLVLDENEKCKENYT
jgi:hypothetical protein